MKVTKRFANKIYDILVNIGDASEDMRDSFIHYFIGNFGEWGEWRFGGKLGMGGKYRTQRNTVDYYYENTTQERDKIVEKINKELKNIENIELRIQKLKRINNEENSITG